jgi:hypothetical protein
MRLVEWVSQTGQVIGSEPEYRHSTAIPLLTLIDASKALVTYNRFSCDPAYHWLIEREH